MKRANDYREKLMGLSYDNLLYSWQRGNRSIRNLLRLLSDIWFKVEIFRMTFYYCRERFNPSYCIAVFRKIYSKRTYKRRGSGSKRYDFMSHIEQNARFQSYSVVLTYSERIERYWNRSRITLCVVEVKSKFMVYSTVKSWRSCYSFPLRHCLALSEGEICKKDSGC